MKYPFKEESDYGQDILDLAGLVASLMEDRDYSKTEINTKMIFIKNKAFNIQKSMAGRDKDIYFRFDNQEGDVNGS